MRLPHAVPLARIIAFFLLGATALVAQERPLPAPERFLRDLRTRLQTHSTLQSGYIYVETRREQKVDGRGQVEQESVKVYERYPGLPGEDRWERLIAENGRPRGASDLEKELRNRQKKFLVYNIRMERRELLTATHRRVRV